MAGESRYGIRTFSKISTLKLDDRQELLHWLNSLLQLNVTKVEQCGTGYVESIIQIVCLRANESFEQEANNICRAALCQVYDSIFREQPQSTLGFTPADA